ncbi:MAG: hypothetical protein WAT67_05030 [Candidatus Contendobacter sp.]
MNEPTVRTALEVLSGAITLDADWSMCCQIEERGESSWERAESEG